MISTLDHDLAISLGQMTCLSSLDHSSVGLLITDLAAFRSSNDLTNEQSHYHSISLHIIISFPGHRPHNNCPPVLWSVLVIIGLYDSLVLTACPPFDVHNGGDLGCVVLNAKVANVEEIWRFIFWAIFSEAAASFFGNKRCTGRQYVFP